MQTVTSFQASAVPPEQLSGIVADYLALDRARICRRLLVVRCGLLALGAGLASVLLHRVSPVAPWFACALFLVAPVWAWIAELRLAHRLSRRVDGIDGIVTYKVVPTTRTLAGNGRKKVIKSS